MAAPLSDRRARVAWVLPKAGEMLPDEMKFGGSEYQLLRCKSRVIIGISGCAFVDDNLLDSSSDTKHSLSSVPNAIVVHFGLT